MNKRLLFLGTFFLTMVSCSKPIIEADILIRNGRVYNGFEDGETNDVIVVKGDKILFIGGEKDVSIKAKKIIDATGLIVSPGFIDPHTHADRDLNKPKTSHNLPFIMQGVTTVVAGNDGDSFFPARTYVDKYEKQGIGTNAILLIGHETMRKEVIGLSDRVATDNEITEMKKLLKKEMNDAGNFGMSTGLFYAPGSYSETKEVIELAKTCAENGGIYDTHLRDESSYTVGLIAAVEEALEIGRQAKLPIHISHIKCLGVDVWGQSDTIISMVEKARKNGVEITANQYPYEASATGLRAATTPKWAQSGGTDSLLIRFDDPKLKQRILKETKNNIRRRGGPESLLVVVTANPNYRNKTLLQIAQELNLSPEEAVYKVLRTKGIARVASFNMSNYDIQQFMKMDWVTTGSDGNTGHPRKYGSFPRKYNKYVKEDRILDLPNFIKNSSSKTAEIFKIPNRGKLKEGYFADIILFNPQTFRDRADYKNAFHYAEGLEYSIINGKLAVEKGEYTDGLFGRVLRKNNAN
ncbi:N-acyl-D-amino-acid deacylase family protein [Flagellimonas flava]|uniref:N-acyl-D-aspartate/D-glutamate deacylase n=1 Tax=Flagellimonas flava TaxID=570519 RepID=A0A1M5MYT8_9FLAO|nr:amidohydrolase family protein [Allomuricauda flava]SHG81913.1 N-acyl-D-aspartate/D-glutamate deacylase [Allomuricauda flava]